MVRTIDSLTQSHSLQQLNPLGGHHIRPTLFAANPRVAVLIQVQLERRHHAADLHTHNSTDPQHRAQETE